MAQNPSVFYADAVLFDMDGTLTDSIAAVEAAWAKVAKDIGQDPAYVISSTHGKRAIDNLSEFKPHIKESDIEAEVARFEESILFFADAYQNSNSASSVDDASIPMDACESRTITPIDINVAADGSTPDLTPGSTAPTTRRSSIVQPETTSMIPSLGSRLFNMYMLNNAIRSGVIRTLSSDAPSVADPDHTPIDGLPDIIIDSPTVADKAKIQRDVDEAWRAEAASIDRSVRILPGVRALIDSIPEGRYAVATSGAKTYAYGCMSRVGIIPPAVTITADDKRLKAGKPAPDPFLLAAECLGYEASNCVVFEDSPSGIKAGLASGATVVALCTSHERSKLKSCGAHYLLDTMESIKCEVDSESGKLKFMII
ncbi:HAD-like domain-containing protein [Panaeolus papilionaceus]|nr:HAD-like domain-containing protein [Panaeolus papilionaceus]